VRFYKAPGDPGTHVGKLWSRTGQLLASADFTGETASGWQQVNFSSPVAITANTTYVASFFSSNGQFGFDPSYFNAPVGAGPLRALASGTDGPNGVYSAGSAFPTQSYLTSNFWVDVAFSTR
jgi:hypothetical protein